MENTFEKAYQEYKIFDKAFEEASSKGDETGMEKGREEYRVWKKRYEEKGSVFAAIYSEYEDSRNNGNEDLDFHNYINETEKYVACLKENGVKRFTFSSNWSGAITNAIELQKAGCRMVGMKEVKGGKDWKGTQKPLAALIFEIN